jgi:hypothetical protein
LKQESFTLAIADYDTAACGNPHRVRGMMVTASLSLFR